MIGGHSGQPGALAVPHGENTPQMLRDSPESRLVSVAGGGQMVQQRVYRRADWKVLGTYSLEADAKAAMKSGQFGKWRSPQPGETTGKVGDRRYMCNEHVGCQVCDRPRIELRISHIITMGSSYRMTFSCPYRLIAPRIGYVSRIRQVPLRILQDTRSDRDGWSVMVYCGIAHTTELKTKKRKNSVFTYEQEEAYQKAIKFGESTERVSSVSCAVSCTMIRMYHDRIASMYLRVSAPVSDPYRMYRHRITCGSLAYRRFNSSRDPG